MTNIYQTSRPMTSAELRLALPETVSVAMGEIAEDVQEGVAGAGRRRWAAGDGRDDER